MTAADRPGEDIKRLCANFQVRMTARPYEEPPPFGDGIEMDGWLCTFRMDGRKMTDVPYWMGTAHRDKNTRRPRPPRVEQVLDSLLSDASLIEDSFEDFCSNLGYNTDSRKDYSTYLAIQANTERLKALLGSFYTRFFNAERL